MATNSKDPVVMADWLEPGQYVSNVSDVELELAGWERCDVLVMNRHGRRWMRYAIGGGGPDIQLRTFNGDVMIRKR
jgi:hypothetical protein